MTKKIAGKHQMKASPTDADAWNKEVQATRKRIIREHGEGRFRPNVSDTGLMTWTLEVDPS